MYILGISSFYHDSAAALIKDGKVEFAIEEERFTRVKHDNCFPQNAINVCLKSVGIDISRVNYIAYYEKPLLKFERILETFVETYPRSLAPFVKSLPEWIGEKIKVEKIIRNTGFTGKIFFIPHHLSHASVAFFPSPFKKSAILTIDGVGDRATTALWLGNDRQIQPIKHLDFPDSLGLLYSAFTAFLGFRVNNDEYKVMGLAAYGKPDFSEKIRKIIDVKADGSLTLDMNYFSFRESFRMWSDRFEKTFGPPRGSGVRIAQRHKNLAASLQNVFEEVYFCILNHLYQETKVNNLCIAGGVALNSLANGKIYANTFFKHIYNVGAAGDSGAAIGAALYTYYKILAKGKRSEIKDLYLGNKYSNDEVEKVLKKYRVRYTKYTQEAALIRKTAGLLKSNKIVGWFQGRMEFGPRALGARSILANPRLRKMKDAVNKIKRREHFRPFAGSVLQDFVHTLFKVPEKKHYSPFMNFCFTAKNGQKEKISAIVHEDGTCRIQTVNASCGRYYRLIKEFYKLSGTPCILNTSFNLSTEPIVASPDQAIYNFLHTSMDALVIGDFIASKS